jgi:hypothetical protein
MNCFLIFLYKIIEHKIFFKIFMGDPGPWLGLFHSKFGLVISLE